MYGMGMQCQHRAMVVCQHCPSPENAFACCCRAAADGATACHATSELLTLADPIPALWIACCCSAQCHHCMPQPPTLPTTSTHLATVPLLKLLPAQQHILDMRGPAAAAAPATGASPGAVAGAGCGPHIKVLVCVLGCVEQPFGWWAESLYDAPQEVMLAGTCISRNTIKDYDRLFSKGGPLCSHAVHGRHIMNPHSPPSAAFCAREHKERPSQLNAMCYTTQQIKCTPTSSPPTSLNDTARQPTWKQRQPQEHLCYNTAKAPHVVYNTPCVPPNTTSRSGRSANGC